MAHSLMFGGAEGRDERARGDARRGTSRSRRSSSWRKQDAAAAGTTVEVVTRPEDAVRGAHVVYTDVFASMGQEAEAQVRLKAFAGYQVTPELMETADKEAIFMHCLPCHRGEEVAAAVADGARVRDLRRGGEPPARAEGDHADADDEPALSFGAAGGRRR